MLYRPRHQKKSSIAQIRSWRHDEATMPHISPNCPNRKPQPFPFFTMEVTRNQQTLFNVYMFVCLDLIRKLMTECKAGALQNLPFSVRFIEPLTPRISPISTSVFNCSNCSFKSLSFSQ